MASTTWKRVLADLRGLKQGVFVHRPKLWRRLRECNEEERSFRLKTYFKFIFVRKPFRRFLSAFKDKFIGKNRICSKNIRRTIIKRYRPNDFDPNNAADTSLLLKMAGIDDHVTFPPIPIQEQNKCPSSNM